ncbi:hypothetical protein QL285_096828 [Trifolium repens]|nr:hypothetical protein QL285_096828 [Trifolium repens]
MVGVVEKCKNGRTTELCLSEHITRRSELNRLLLHVAIFPCSAIVVMSLRKRFDRNYWSWKQQGIRKSILSSLFVGVAEGFSSC